MPESTDFAPLLWIGLFAAGGLILFFFLIFVVKQYKRCPSNRILVIYGRVGGQKAAKCLHGGGAFVIPLIQDYEYLSLDPLVIEIPLEGALSLNNIRVNVPSTFTVGISTDPVLMNNAAERLLMLDEHTIREQAQDIILGQLRLVIATLSIEEINKDLLAVLVDLLAVPVDRGDQQGPREVHGPDQRECDAGDQQDRARADQCECPRHHG